MGDSLEVHRAGLAQTQRKLAASRVPVPDEIRDAQERLNSQQRAVALAMRTRDNAALEQNLRTMEDTLAAIAVIKERDT